MAERLKLSDQVRQAVEASEMTRYRLWQLTGIDQATLSRFVAGRAGLSLANLDRLAEVLELEVVRRRPTASPARKKRTSKQQRERK